MEINIKDLKSIFFEEEQQANTSKAELEQLKQETARAKADLEKAKFELAKAKAKAQQEQAGERLAIARARERRAEELHQARQQQAEKQRRTEMATFWASILATFGSIIASVILFIFIILKG